MLFQSLTPVRHQRQNRQRIDEAVMEHIENINGTRVTHDSISSTFASNSEERQILRERRFEEDRRQRELDREERKADREASKHNTLLMIGCVKSLAGVGVPSSIQTAQQERREFLVQYCPSGGDNPLPTEIAAQSIGELLR